MRPPCAKTHFSGWGIDDHEVEFLRFQRLVQLRARVQWPIVITRLDRRQVSEQVGARVALNGRTAQTVDAAIAELGRSDRLVAAPGNIGAVDGCQAAVRAAVEGLGGLDVLVNSAGVAKDVSIEESDEALWNKTLDINLKGTFFSCQAALRTVKGNIVNVASDAGALWAM